MIEKDPKNPFPEQERLNVPGFTKQIAFLAKRGKTEEEEFGPASTAHFPLSDGFILTTIHAKQLDYTISQACIWKKEQTGNTVFFPTEAYTTIHKKIDGVDAIITAGVQYQQFIDVYLPEDTSRSDSEISIQKAKSIWEEKKAQTNNMAIMDILRGANQLEPFEPEDNFTQETDIKENEDGSFDVSVNTVWYESEIDEETEYSKAEFKTEGLERLAQFYDTIMRLTDLAEEIEHEGGIQKTAAYHLEDGQFAHFRYWKHDKAMILSAVIADTLFDETKTFVLIPQYHVNAAFATKDNNALVSMTTDIVLHRAVGWKNITDPNSKTVPDCTLDMEAEMEKIPKEDAVNWFLELLNTLKPINRMDCKSTILPPLNTKMVVEICQMLSK